MDESQNNETSSNDNKYLGQDFWDFAILATLMIVFFPWSLLFCVIFFGIDDTKLIIAALLHDLLKTIFALLVLTSPLILIIIYLVVSTM